MSDKTIKRIFKMFQWTLAVVFTAGLLITFKPCLVSAAESGDCGANATWTLENGVLTIYGSGNIQSYTEDNMPPWYETRTEVIEIIIGEGITGIGDLVFYECSSVQSVTLPSTITSIGNMSFAGCTSLARVSFNEGLLRIGENAFARCESLNAIVLPSTLIKIGDQAFYRCSLLSSVRIPAMVSQLGTGVFAYCTGMIQAVIEGMITELPVWTFYGCTSLVSVSLPSNLTEVGEYAFFDCENLENAYYEGDANVGETIKEQIKQDIPDFTDVTLGSNINGSSSSVDITQDATGNIVKTDREVVDKNDVSINVTVQQTKPMDSNQTVHDVTIDATIGGENGWDELLDETDQYITYPDRIKNENTSVNKVNVTIKLNDTTSVPAEVLQKYAGKKVDLTIYTSDNIKWIIDCESIDASKLKDEYKLEYTVTKNINPTKAQKELIGEAESYLVRFAQEIPFDVTIAIRVGIPYSRLFASFCQNVSGETWEIMQSVLIEDSGYASFYLNSLKAKNSYVVAIDVAGIGVEEVLIPNELLNEYGGLVDEYGTKYVVTGRKSTWDMEIGQVTWILVGVLTATVVAVGVIMYILNKRSQILSSDQEWNRK